MCAPISSTCTELIRGAQKSCQNPIAHPRMQPLSQKGAPFSKRGPFLQKNESRMLTGKDVTCLVSHNDKC
jgi:hypothetical protein